MQRGHNRIACLFDDEDWLAYLGWLGETVARKGYRPHADALMVNHFRGLRIREQGWRLQRVLISVGRRN